MQSLNHYMNRIDGWRQPINPSTNFPQGLMRRHLATRAATAFCCFPLEVAAVAQNVLLSPVQFPCAILKLAVKPAARVFKSSQLLQKLNNKLPYTFTDFFRTVARVAGYAIGAFLTITLGVLSPSANFRLHAALGLVDNQRGVVLKHPLEEQQQKKQEAIQEGILKTLIASQEVQEDIKKMLDEMTQEAKSPEDKNPVVNNEEKTALEQEVLAKASVEKNVEKEEVVLNGMHKENADKDAELPKEPEMVMNGMHKENADKDAELPKEPEVVMNGIHKTSDSEAESNKTLKEKEEEPAKQMPINHTIEKKTESTSTRKVNRFTKYKATRSTNTGYFSNWLSSPIATMGKEAISSTFKGVNWAGSQMVTAGRATKDFTFRMGKNGLDFVLAYRPW